MSLCIIYHSETGNTRSVAERLAAATGGDLVEVKDRAGYSKMGMYLKGMPRALLGHKADIEPGVIDVSGYDAIIIGSPVWGGNPTPAINAAVDALQGIEGKTVFIYCTSRGSPQKTLEKIKAMLAERGADVRGCVSLTESDVQSSATIESLADLVRRSEKKD
jgi:flavodoxin